MIFNKYQFERVTHWDLVSQQQDQGCELGSYYHKRLKEIYRNIVIPGQRVLEIGCGTGDLLASVKPGYGVGIDFSGEMIDRAKQKYPNLTFIQQDAHNLNLGDVFDVIILSDAVNDLWDVQKVLEEVVKCSNARTRIVINFYSHLWEQPLKLAQGLGLATSTLPQNWLTVEDVTNMLNLSSCEVIKHWREVLLPVSIPIVSKLANNYLVKTWPFDLLALTNVIIARLTPRPKVSAEKPLVSVVVPSRNEAENIPEIIDRIPEMGSGTEIIFVEGNSKDNSYEVAEREIASHPQRKCKLYRQTGVGKGDAVRLGFEKASSGVLMILDADMTVRPEDLPRFYDVLITGKAEFVNGVRLVYPMRKQAMRFLNLLGNKFFSLAFSWLLGQPIKDTLCGTKVLWKSEYELIARNRSFFGEFDPFGDFDLLFGAARLGLRIADMPIRYCERTYGVTNISRWRHGWLLLKMVVFAARRIKFV